MNRFVLGTAQLGMAYGVANSAGQPSFEEALRIVSYAFENDVRYFDTASGYGESEATLGRCFKQLGIEKEVNVISKITELPGSLELLRTSIKESENKLCIPKLKGLLFHREDTIKDWGNGDVEKVSPLIEEGLSLGVSIYHPEYALKALEIPELTKIQVPCNSLDRRLDQAGFFEKARRLGKEIYIRSIFLQGLLLMKKEEVPKGLSVAVPYLERLDVLSKELKISRKQLLVSYMKQRYPDCFLIFGTETLDQVQETMALYDAECVLPSSEMKGLGAVPEFLLSPALWPK